MHSYLQQSKEQAILVVRQTSEVFWFLNHTLRAERHLTCGVPQLTVVQTSESWDEICAYLVVR
jgi:hypothetical protein